MTQETITSPETQELIDLLNSLKDEPQNRATLLQRAETRLEEMHRAADSFFSQIDAEGAEFYQQFRSHFEAIEDYFRLYGDTLEDILDNDFDPSEAAHDLAEASRGLRFGMARYEEAYLSRGPSRYGVINLFANVARAIEDGRTPAEAWGPTCQRYRTFYSQAATEIDQSSAAKKPGVPERRAALQEILECIDELEVIPDADDAEPILARMTRAHTDLDHAFDLYHEHEFSQDPTRAPRINWLIKAAQGVLNGTHEPWVLEDLAQDLFNTTKENLKELKSLTRDRLESAVVTDELDILIEEVEEIEDALSLLLDFSQGVENSRQQVEYAISDLIESGDNLVESIKIIRDAHERAGMVTCIQCQRLQEKGSNACVSCGAVLPIQSDAGAYAPAASSFQLLEGDPGDIDRDEVTTDVLQVLFEHCEAFIRGRESAEELRSHVAECFQEVERAERALARMSAPVVSEEIEQGDGEMAQTFVDIADDALILLDHGVTECRSGLLEIDTGATLDDLDKVRQGMRSYYEGIQKMWQVKRLERQFSEYLEEDRRSSS